MDQGRLETDRKLEELERKIKAEYSRAEKELREKMEDYFRRFAIKDKIKRDQLARGVITEAEYKQWKIGQLAIGKRWQEMVDTVAADLANAEGIAKSIANGYMPEIYCINFNFETFSIEKQARIDTSFTLYNHEAVERILKKEPMLLPPPGRQMQQKIASGAVEKWRKGQIQSVTTQAIIQGESIPNMATRISDDLCVHDRKAAIRYARTACTGAENAGRDDSFHRMQGLGIKLKRTWVAVLDSRTRYAHRELDGVTVGLDEPFENSIGQILYPGDPSADPENLWNCRCGLISQVEGFETDVLDLRIRNTDKLDGMSYDEWKKEHGKSQSILHQDEMARIMRARYARDYRR